MATQTGDLGRHRQTEIDQKPRHGLATSTRYEHSTTTFKHYEDETRVVAVLEENGSEVNDGDKHHDDASGESHSHHRPPTLHRWRPKTRSASATLPSGCSLEQPPPPQPSYQNGQASGEPPLFSAIASIATSANGTSNNTYVATTNGHQPASGGSPQKVRVVAGEVQRERRCRPASADRFGSSSQRASRFSLGPAHSTNRMGRFVNYYPASRQPSPSRRQPSPYAFHVPLHQQRNNYNPYNTASRATPSYQSQQQVACGNSRATSPSYTYANFSPDDYSPSTINDSYSQQQQQQQQPDGLGLQQCRRLVTPTTTSSGRNAPGKFNKSLRSRTISHLPSMVQVTIEDEDYAQYPNSETTTARKHLTTANSTSESDLVRRQPAAKVWRSDAQINQDNPFKPGTELSWEADLMVRLIKRGYPINQLPSLVEAAKLEAAARQQRKQQQPATTKSCDRLETTNTEAQQREGTKQYPSAQTQAKTSGGGYLRSNLRQANQARQLSSSTNTVNQRRPISSAISHSNLIVASAKPNGQLGLAAAEHQGHHKQPASGGAVGAPNDCKAIWADSLRRAKSVPRFHQTDADSLDKLITSIELEIGELLETGSPETLAKPTESENRGGQPVGLVANDDQNLDSPTKLKMKTMAAKKKKTLARQQSASKSSSNNNGTKLTELKTNRAHNGKNNRRNEPSVSSGTKTMSGPLTSNWELKKEKKTKPKCCTIQ